MFIRGRKDFLLLENLKQAKQYLKKNNYNLEDTSKSSEFYQDRFNHIVNSLNKLPNLIDTFTRMVFPEVNVKEVGQDYHVHPQLINSRLEEFDNIANWIKDNKNIVNQLPKNITQYKDLEELSDAIVQLELTRKINKFTKSLYRSMREEVKRLSGEKLERYNNAALAFMEMDDKAKEQFTPLYIFEKNDISFDEFLSSLEKFVNGQDVNEKEKEVRNYVKKHNLKTTWDKNGVIVIQTNDKEHVCNLGSQRWCIVYSDHYFNNYIGNKLNTQFIIYNFNLPTSNPNSMFGITIKPDGDLYGYGTSQNKSNHHVELDKIKDITGISDESLESNYKEEYDRISKNINDIRKLYDDISDEKDFDEWVEKYSQYGFDNLDIVQFGFNYSYVSIINLMVQRFDNLVELFKYFIDKDKKGVLKTLAKNFNQRTYGVKVMEKNTLEEWESLDPDFIFETMNMNTEFENYIFSFGVDIGDRMFLAKWINDDPSILWKLSNFNSNNYKYSFFIHSVIKYGWEKIVQFVIENPKFIENNLRLSKEVIISDYSTEKAINNKNYRISVEQYNVLTTSLEISANNTFPTYLTIFLDIGDKIELSKLGNPYIFNTFEDNDWNEYIEYLDKLDLKECLGAINNNADKNIFFRRNFERISSRHSNFFNKIIDDIIEGEKIDVISALIEYPYIFITFSKSLSASNMTEKIKNKSFSKILLLDALKRSTTSLSDTPIETLIEMGFKSDEVLQVYKNIDELTKLCILKIKEGQSKSYNKDNPNIVYNPLNSRSEKEVYNGIKTYLMGRIKSYTKAYLSTLDILIEDEKRGWDYRVIKQATYKNNFEKFNEYWEDYKKLEFILKTDDDYEEGQLFLDELPKILSYWGGRDPKTYNGYADSLFPEVSLFDVIDKYLGDVSYLLDDDYVENMDTDYLTIVGKLFLDKKIEGNNSSIIKYAKYLASNDKEVHEDYYEEIGLSRDEETNQLYYVTDFEKLWNLYDNKDYNNLLDTETMYDVDYWGYNDYYPDDIFEELDMYSLFELSHFLYDAGFDFLDLSVFDKYKKHIKKRQNGNWYYFDLNYNQTNDLMRKDKDLYNLKSEVADVIKKGLENDYEEAYDNIDIEEIKSCFSAAYGEVDRNGIISERWENNVDELGEVLEEWKGKKNLHKYLKWHNDMKVRIIPNIDLIESDDMMASLSEWSGLNDFDAFTIIKSYLDINGYLKIQEGSDYYSWNDGDYDDFNEQLRERLSWDVIKDGKTLEEFLNESKIAKFENFEFEIDRQFLGEFSSEEDAKEDLEYYKNQINYLQKNGGKIYRLVFLKNISDLDTDNLGEHWTLERDQLSNFYYSLNSDMDKKPYLITGYINSNSIDEEYSYSAYKQLPHELEVNLKKPPYKYEISPYKGNIESKRLWEKYLY
jgi:hypothetical protein